MFERVLVATDLEDGNVPAWVFAFRISTIVVSRHLTSFHAVPWGDRQVGGIPESHAPEIKAAREAIQQYIDHKVAEVTFNPTITAKVGKPGEILQTSD